MIIEVFYLIYFDNHILSYDKKKHDLYNSFMMLSVQELVILSFGENIYPTKTTIILFFLEFVKPLKIKTTFLTLKNHQRTQLSLSLSASKFSPPVFTSYSIPSPVPYILCDQILEDQTQLDPLVLQPSAPTLLGRFQFSVLVHFPLEFICSSLSLDLIIRFHLFYVLLLNL